MPRTASLTRRVVLATAALSIVALTGVTAVRPASSEAGDPPRDEWLRKVNTRHKMVFDSPQPAGGIGLIHMMNYYDSYNSAYNVRDNDIRGIFTFYGMTTLHALNDAMWAKYRIGEIVNAEDPATKQPATVNPWRTSPEILGMSLPGASIETLQKRGGIFIVCNNALTIFAGMVAQARGMEPSAVYDDFKANILPGVELVPAMVVALEQAHKAGAAYQRQ